MSNPLVTVILPAYNHQEFVEDSINAIIGQDYQNIELIILNDGSKDNTHQVISSLLDKCKARFVRFEYVNKTNEGLANTLNQGVFWSKADYVTVIASDDIMKSNKVSVLLKALLGTSNEIALSYADADFIDSHGNYIFLDDKGDVCQSNTGWGTFISFYTRRRKDIKGDFFDYTILLKGNFLPAMSVMWKADALKKVGMFTPNIIIEDWDLWLRMARSFQGVYVPHVVASYRWHETNTVKTAKVKLLKAQDLILKREFYFEDNKKEIKNIILYLLFLNGARLFFAKEYSFAMKSLLDVGLMFLGAKQKVKI